MNVRKIVATWSAVAFALVGLAAASATAHASSPPPQLPYGFVVASGSTLVGGVFTTRDEQTAFLDVTGDAGSVFNGYLDQAISLGFRALEQSRCTEDTPGDIRCTWTGSANDGRATYLSLRVCATCMVPVSAAVMSFSNASHGSSAAVPTVETMRVPGSAVELDAAARLRKQRALPKAGHLFPVDATNSAPGQIHVVRGTRALAIASLGDCISGDSIAVVSSRRPMTEVFRDYRDQIRAEPNESPVRSTRERIDGTVVATAFGDWSNVMVVRQRSTTLALVRTCVGD